MNTIKIAIVQMENNIEDVKKNVQKTICYIEEAAKNNAKYIAFGECALTGYTSDANKLKTINFDDDIFISLIDACMRNKVTLFTGANLSIDDKIYNSYIMIKATGEKEIYHKSHLGKKESLIFEKGGNLNSFETSDAIFGTAICIESHIPEMFLSHSIRGAEVMLLPFASPINCGGRKDIWNKYIPSRGYDFSQYIICMNLTGVSYGLLYDGGVMVTDPKGNVIYENYDREEKMAVVTLNNVKINKIRNKDSKVNYIARRRVELYQI
ncbi:MAG: nitrilase-related carbon-nitrogen hydrolase [Bacillota bacterium]|nr:nitrilase-related carbon-nitrogen hydrolase [Bacillota bacterium]